MLCRFSPLAEKDLEEIGDYIARESPQRAYSFIKKIRDRTRLNLQHCPAATKTFIIETNGYAWARNMKRLLQETCVKVSQSTEKKLDDKELVNLQKRYRNILTRGAKELPVIPPKQTGKRGKLAKSDAHNLLERLHNHESSVLLFAKDPHVSFTNNRAERDLRMSKVKQKVSGCFRSEQYARAYCRISSCLQTMANKGYNPLIAIQIALAGQLDLLGGE